MAGELSDLLRRCAVFAGAVLRFAKDRAAETAVFVALAAVLDGCGVLLLVPLLAILLGGDASSPGASAIEWATRFGPDWPPLQRLMLLLALFALVMAARTLVLWRRDLLLGRLQVEFVERQRAGLASALAGARWQTLAELGHGRISHLLGEDSQRCGAAVHFLLQGGVAVIMLAVQIGLAVLVSPALAAISGALLLIAGSVMFPLVRRAHRAGRLLTEANLSLMTGLGRFLGGMKLAMSQNLQGRFVEAFTDDLGSGARRQVEFIGEQALLRGAWGLLGALISGFAVLVGFGWLALPVPMLLAFVVVLARVSGPAMQIQMALQQVAYGLPTWEALRSAHAHLSGGAGPPARPRGAKLAGTIGLDDVRFRHPGRARGLHGISLRIEPHEVLGITGPSGAGKTTLADILAGLLTPQEGSLTVGPIRVEDDNCVGWREQVGYLAQDAFLFHDSIRRNLLWANPQANDRQLAAALEIAGADQLLARLPDGLDTIVGERGALVSGGERQRLGLARALLRAPDLLILDEATSALDLAGERALLDRLLTMERRPTIVIISHRLETVSLCDRVLVIEDGQAVSESRPLAA